MKSNLSNNTKMAEKTIKYIAGGTNSPGRLFSEVETPMLIAEKGCGAHIYDVDGNKYLDLLMGLGPCILGHSPEKVSKAIKHQIDKGTVYGISNKLESSLAELIIESSKHIDKLRFTCSGTEAVMTAIRIARGITKKSYIIKFSGCYHGHSDTTLTGSNKKSIAEKTPSDGILQSVKESTINCRYNDIQQIEELFSSHSEDIACVIIEPVATNMGLVPASVEFLKRLRELCTDNGSLLIFDEVVSAYRFHFGPVSNELAIVPDLTTFGKIIGGGLSIGAYGGTADIMQQVEMEGGVFQGGTFAGNPITMSAGIATLNELKSGLVYERINALTDLFVDETNSAIRELGLAYTLIKKGSLVSFILQSGIKKLNNLDDVKRQDTKLFSRLHLDLFKVGILLPPTIEEPLFFSGAHTQAHAKQLTDAISASLKNSLIDKES